MSTAPSMASHLIVPITLLIFFATIQVTRGELGQDDDFVRTQDGNLNEVKQEKLSQFRVYWHDIYGGSKPSAMPIVKPPGNSTVGFGAMSMIDDPLTLGPELSSKLVGRAQGLYALASQEETALLMVMNFVFLQGKYNGSTITILGRNALFNKVREMPVIGGSGVFRFARGYVHASTYIFDIKSGNAVVEYNVHVLHY